MNNEYFCVDLKNCFNHKLLSCKEEQIISDENNGLDGIFIDNTKFLEGVIYHNNIPFRINIGTKDNIACSGQQIKINKKAKSIYLFGAMFWGANICKYKIVYNSGREEIANVYFSDWSSNIVDGAFEAYGGNAETGLFKSTTFGKLKHDIFFTIYKMETEAKEEIQYIELPDYYLMHLYAITLEV